MISTPTLLSPLTSSSLSSSSSSSSTGKATPLIITFAGRSSHLVRCVSLRHGATTPVPLGLPHSWPCLRLRLLCSMTCITASASNHPTSSRQPFLEEDSMNTKAPKLKPGSSKVLTLPTILTLGRLAAIPALLFAFYSTEYWATTAAAIIFILAAVTDWLDGYLARKMGSDSAFGAFLDPVADKLMVATCLVLLSTKPLAINWATNLPWLIPLPAAAIIGREITMSAVREWAAAQGGEMHTAVAVNNLGKWKTAAQMVSLTILLATRDASYNELSTIVMSGVGMLYLSMGLSLWSLFIYMKSIWAILAK